MASTRIAVASNASVPEDASGAALRWAEVLGLWKAAARECVLGRRAVTSVYVLGVFGCVAVVSGCVPCELIASAANRVRGMVSTGVTGVLCTTRSGAWVEGTGEVAVHVVVMCAGFDVISVSVGCASGALALL